MRRSPTSSPTSKIMVSGSSPSRARVAWGRRDWPSRPPRSRVPTRTVFFVPLAEGDEPRAGDRDRCGVARRPRRGLRPLPDTIAEQLAADRVLLVLDNFEQVLGAAAVVAELLGAAPARRCSLRAGSPCGCAASASTPVPPLRVPSADMEERGGSNALPCSSSSTVLVPYGPHGRRPEPKLRPSRRSAVASTGTRSPRSSSPLRACACSTRVASGAPRQRGSTWSAGASLILPDRQRTLTATIDWSHELLDEAERIVFARLSLFVG